MRLASMSSSTIEFGRIMMRKSAVWLTGRVAVARSLPSCGDTSRYLPACAERMATISPSLGRKVRMLLSPVVATAVKSSRPPHAMAEAMISFLDMDIGDDVSSQKLAP